LRLPPWGSVCVCGGGAALCGVRLLWSGRSLASRRGDCGLPQAEREAWGTGSAPALWRS
jgi:hypothetical protein